VTVALRARLGREDGFTLIEMVSSLFGVVLLMAGFSLVYTTVIRQTTQVQESSLLQTEARSAIDRLVGELRQAYVGDGTVPITSMSATAITFTTPDRQTPFHLLKVSYQLAGASFQRAFATSTNTSSTGPPWTMGSTSSWATVVGSVQNATTVFTYFDSSGAATTDPNQVSTVTVRLRVATAAATSRSYTYTASATLRANWSGT